MIQVVPYVPEDVLQLKKYVALTHLSNEELGIYANNFYVDGFSFTILVDAHPIGCAGIVPLWQGVAEAWCLFSGEVYEYPVFLHRSVKERLPVLAKKGGFRRIQATVKADFLNAHKWIKRLGFVSEGLMPRYGPDGQDHVRYSKIYG